MSSKLAQMLVPGTLFYSGLSSTPKSGKSEIPEAHTHQTKS